MSSKELIRILPWRRTDTKSDEIPLCGPVPRFFGRHVCVTEANMAVVTAEKRTVILNKIHQYYKPLPACVLRWRDLQPPFEAIP